MNPTNKQSKHILVIIDAFTKFEDYWSGNDIEHNLITTGIPRGNGQVERLNRTIISVLSKLCDSDDHNWYKVVKQVTNGFK